MCGGDVVVFAEAQFGEADQVEVNDKSNWQQRDCSGTMGEMGRIKNTLKG